MFAKLNLKSAGLCSITMDFIKLKFSLNMHKPRTQQLLMFHSYFTAYVCQVEFQISWFVLHKPRTQQLESQEFLQSLYKYLGQTFDISFLFHCLWISSKRLNYHWTDYQKAFSTLFYNFWVLKKKLILKMYSYLILKLCPSLILNKFPSLVLKMVSSLILKRFPSLIKKISCSNFENVSFFKFENISCFDLERKKVSLILNIFPSLIWKYILLWFWKYFFFVF